jgi:hypothetical protein
VVEHLLCKYESFSNPSPTKKKKLIKSISPYKNNQEKRDKIIKSSNESEDVIADLCILKRCFTKLYVTKLDNLHEMDK